MTAIETARRAAGLSRPDVFRLLGIPVRTLENWEFEKTACPDWCAALIVEKLKNLDKKKPPLP